MLIVLWHLKIDDKGIQFCITIYTNYEGCTKKMNNDFKQQKKSNVDYDKGGTTLTVMMSNINETPPCAVTCFGAKSHTI